MEKAMKRYFPIFILPTLLAFIIGFLVPFVMGLWLSLCEFTTVTDATFVGLKNYIRAVQDAVFQHAFWYTAAFALVSVVVINVLAFAVALALTQKMARNQPVPHGVFHAQPHRRHRSGLYWQHDLQRNPGAV